jgi:hypothetical protein
MTEVIIDVFKSAQTERGDASLQQQINRLAIMLEMQDERIRDLCAELEDTKASLARLMLTPAEGGMFPPIPEIERFVAQVFHNPAMAAEKSREGGKTPWSLKIEYWHRAKKQPGINIALYPPRHVLGVLKGKSAPQHIIDTIAKADPEHVMVGLVRRKLQNGGRPYLTDQVAMLMDYNLGIANTKLALLIGKDGCAIFDKFTASNGTKKGKSLCVASHIPNRKIA